jgi:hypothetical protein
MSRKSTTTREPHRVPAGVRPFAMVIIEACDDYRWLLARGYPAAAALKLVGDRHRLPRVERNALFRGAFDPVAAAARRRKLVDPDAVRGRPLAVDWYNVLITVETYLAGGTLFLADDGVVRDAAAVHGSWRRGPRTEPATGALAAALARLGPSRLDVFVDAPVAFSGELAGELRASLAAAVPVPVEVSLAASADGPLKRYGGVVASSDSVVIDAATAAVDLPRLALALGWGFSPSTLDGRPAL